MKRRVYYSHFGNINMRLVTLLSDGELGVYVENDEKEECHFLVDCLGISCDFRCVYNVFHI